MRNVRSNIHAGQRSGDEIAISEKLLGFPAVKNARTICVYKAIGGELSLDTFVDEIRACHRHIRIAYPAMLANTNNAIEFAVVKPEKPAPFVTSPTKLVNAKSYKWLNPKEIDLVLVPGLAFDKCGRRLGQGGGSYDRYLARLNSNTIVLGVCFDEQIVEKVPVDINDIPVGYVVTPTQIIAI